MAKILLPFALSPDAEARLAAAGEVVRPPAHDEDTLCAYVADCDAIVARTHVTISRRVLAAGPRLRVVGVPGVGTDRVDVAAADELGIQVVNTPAAATEAVADLALAFMLQLLRPIGRLSAAYRAGVFTGARAAGHGDELHQRTVGIVGMGRIGSAVGRRCAAGFGAQVLYNDIADVGPFDFAAEAVPKDDIWARCDMITLHVPLTPQTRSLIDADVLSRTKPTAYLVNTARGAVVDTAALTAALLGQRIAGAALDVTDPEPLPPEHPLFTCERCLLTPHIAARTHRGLRRMYDVVDAVIAVLRS